MVPPPPLPSEVVKLEKFILLQRVKVEKELKLVLRLIALSPLENVIKSEFL